MARRRIFGCWPCESFGAVAPAQHDHRRAAISRDVHRDADPCELVELRMPPGGVGHQAGELRRLRHLVEAVAPATLARDGVLAVVEVFKRKRNILTCELSRNIHNILVLTFEYR